MSAPRIFDRAVYASRREKAERTGADSFLVDESIDVLVERAFAARRQFKRGVDVGSRNQSFPRLRPIAEDWVRATLSASQSKGPAPAVVADEEYLPFAEASFDLATSVLSLHAINDLPGALLQIRRLLRPGGLFLGCMFGGSTLTELRHAFAAGEQESLGGIFPHVAPFADVRDVGGLLLRAGFALPVADLERATVRYGDFFTLIADLRQLGETNALAQRSRTPMRKETLTSVIANYARQHSDPDGKLKATFDVIHLTGWAA